MAAQLKLVKRIDGGADTDSLDLDAYNAGFNLARDGWQQRTGLDVSNAMTLRVQATSDDNLASVIQALDTKVEEVGWYANQTELNSIWLRHQLTNETEARQAFLHELSHTPPSWSRAERTKFQRLTLGFRRGPWEDTSASQFSSDTGGISGVAGTFTFTSNVGDLPSRIYNLKVESISSPAPIKDFWVGFRTNRYGTPANFQPYWNFSDAFAFGDDTATGTGYEDATAKDGFVATCTFATNESMAYRALIRVTDVTANLTDQAGRFLVLLRAKVGSGSGVTRVRLVTGWGNTTINTNAGPRQEITDTDWVLYELGETTLPSTGTNAALSQNIQYSMLGIAAERISGTATLDFDCLILIPVAEGYASFNSDAEIAGDGHIFVKPDENAIAGAVQTTMVKTVQNFVPPAGLPVGSGIVVLAAQGNDTSTAYLYGVTLNVYQRWQALRGSES